VRITPIDESFIVELFGGPGGMSEGMRLAGVDPVLTQGIDNSRDACDTAEKAGHPRLCMSVAEIAPRDFAATYGMPVGVHGSPPCPGFSAAGKGEGRLDLQLLTEAAEQLAAGAFPPAVMAVVQARQKDPRSALSLEPLRWVLDLRPEWLTLEQVPSVLPLWAAYASALRKIGYSVWTGYVYAEQFGVPQTRKRAVLMASRVREITAPVPTHSRFHTRNPTKLDKGVLKWVSMAEALGWGMVRRPYPTVAAGTASGGADPQMVGGSGARLIIAREREAGDGHWIERAWHPDHGPVHLLGSGLANQQGQRARPLEEPAHTIVSKGTATWRFDDDVERLVGFPRKDDGQGDAVEIDGVLYRARDLRSEDEPAFTLTEKARSWKVYEFERMVGFPRRADELGPVIEIEGEFYRERDLRSEEHPSFTVSAKSRSWRVYEVERAEEIGDRNITHMGDVYNSHGALRPMDHPSATLTSSMDNGNFQFIDADRVSDTVRERLNNQSGEEFDLQWPAYRPAAVVAGREINTAPGANGNRFNGSKKSRNDGVRVTAEEAAALQSFRQDYVFVGTKTSQFQQIGNAVPPLLGEMMIRHVYGLPSALAEREERQ
jgi:DNA (cytosine-5)-methyltransferase 1